VRRSSQRRLQDRHTERQRRRLHDIIAAPILLASEVPAVAAVDPAVVRIGRPPASTDATTWVPESGREEAA
jgi:hypothetical protein